MYGAVLISVLVIVGGLIAFIGDRLGSKVGKKRMSLFGLRPRYTSIIVTIITGIAITTITFGILAVTSKDVRTALFGMEKLQQKIRVTQSNLDEADSNLKGARQKQQQMQTNLEETRSALNDAEVQTAMMKQHQTELLAVNAQLEDKNSDLENQNVYLDETNNTLQKYNNDLTSNNTLLQTQNNTLQGQNNDLLKRNGDLSSKRIIYQAGELVFGGVVPATTDRTAAQDGVAKLIAIADSKVAGELGESITNQTGIWVNQAEYEDALNKICTSNKDMVVRLIAAANMVKDEPVRTNIELYPDKVVYRDREMITNGEFMMDGQQDTAQQILIDFLHNINTIASANGMLPDPLRGSIGVITMNQLYDVTKTMAQFKGKVLLTAYSNGSTDILGPLRLMIKVEEVNEN